ncbi:hypothetical protein FQR65_LT13612 [Abscondita terminalis]|nr:hypothetical protein FQR65_LT13612 [Abscondita terminalis]
MIGAVLFPDKTSKMRGLFEGLYSNGKAMQIARGRNSEEKSTQLQWCAGSGLARCGMERHSIPFCPRTLRIMKIYNLTPKNIDEYVTGNKENEPMMVSLRKSILLSKMKHPVLSDDEAPPNS